MKKQSALFLSNAMTDVVAQVTDAELAELGLTKGQAHHKPGWRLNVRNAKEFPGGSAANTAAGLSRHGVPAGLVATIGPDDHGARYLDDIRAHRVRSHVTTVEGQSGVCYTFITPDGERTFAYDLGVAPKYRIPFKDLPNYGLAHTTGYEYMANMTHAIKFIEVAKRMGITTSFDLANADDVRNHFPLFEVVLLSCDIVFANEEEARALWGSELDETIKDIHGHGPQTVVVKCGTKGSKVSHDGTVYDIPCYPAKPFKNTNGAGDAYAAGFLAGLLQGKPVDECGHLGAKFAAKACMHDGARVPAKEL